MFLGNFLICPPFVLALYLSWVTPNRAWHLQLLFTKTPSCWYNVVFWCDCRCFARNKRTPRSKFQLSGKIMSGIRSLIYFALIGFLIPCYLLKIFFFVVEYSTSRQLPTVFHFDAGCICSLHIVLSTSGVWWTKSNEFLRRAIEISCSFLNSSLGIDNVYHDQQVWISNTYVGKHFLPFKLYLDIWLPIYFQYAN